MDRHTAAALLGVDLDSPAHVVRARYRSLLMLVHPDRNQGPDAAERTMRLTAAYRALQDDASTTADRTTRPRRGGSRPSTRPAEPPASDPTGSSSGGERPPSTDATGTQPGPGDPMLLASTSIGVRLPEPLAMARLLQIASDLGEVTYLDRSAGLLEVVVEFVEAPTSSVVLTVVGHERGSRIDCGVEPLSGGTAPAVEAVTRLVLRALQGENPAD